MSACPKCGAEVEREWLTVKEMSRIMGISRQSIERSVKLGTFPVPAFRPTPGRVLFARSMYERFVETGTPIASAVAS
jgi:predicted DNA-binding transcriptional regulator AlpA